MDAARAFLVLLGLVFALGGVVVASAFDPLAGIVCLVIGSFLLILPFMSSRPDE